jgi:PEP-CTERM motif
MSRFTLRFIPLLALFFALSAVARADSFQITFTGIGSGTGQFTTDGVCTMCSPGPWSLSSLQGDFSGTYTVAPVASTSEPSTLLLLFLSALALASGMAWRRKTPYVTVLSTPAANPW